MVSEGSKTEPKYFDEIRTMLRLPTANITTVPGGYGTSPLQVVEYAKDVFVKGFEEKRIQPKGFEKVFAVFDRDEHTNYHQALDRADSYNRKRIRNDENRAIEFKFIATVPCFELWLLMHFEQPKSPMHREAVYKRLKFHIPQYNKGADGHFHDTKEMLTTAVNHAQNLSSQTNAWDGVESYTNIHELVKLLLNLKTVQL
ncbi:MAG: RloB family protein [Candidatus Thiodiazotropha sp.]